MTNSIAGVKIDFDLTYEDVVKKVVQFVEGNGCHYITTTNPEFIIASQNDSVFKNIINNSDISTPDGVGVLLARTYIEEVNKMSRNLFFPIAALLKGLQIGFTTNVHPVTGQDLLPYLFSYANEYHKSVFILGGMQNTAKVAVSKLLEKYPSLNIIGATSEFSHSEQDDAKTQQYIQKCMREKNVNAIDILLVGYGHVKQEKWISRNSKQLNVKVSIGVGGSLDVIAGFKKRAPLFLRKAKLEWFYRLIQEPTRFGRIINAAIKFPLLVYKQTVFK